MSGEIDCSARRWLIVVALVLASAGLVGCEDDGNPFVISVEPFYTLVDLETDSRLNGAWTDEEGDVTFTFEQPEEKGKEQEKEQKYTLLVKIKDGGTITPSEFDAHLVRLGGYWFLDFYPKAAAERNEFYRIHFIRAHTIARVEIKQDSMEMAFLSASWLKARIKEKSVDTPHMKPDEALLLTAATKEVQNLVCDHANDDEAFPDPFLLHRYEAQEDEEP